jgi:EAL domain-containing protein (putative c-di-GMP-specific phosphodiesterase class I)
MIQQLESATDPQAVRTLVLVVNAQLATEQTHLVASVLHPMLKLGCTLSVSGFGARGSSLKELSDQLPLSFLSFDHGLMQDALESERALATLSDIQSQARTLGIITIAKQVQNPDTLGLAKNLGVDWGQGYLLGVPTDPAWPLSARSNSR